MKLKSLHVTASLCIALFMSLAACGKQQPTAVIQNDPGPQAKETRLADKVKDALKDNIFLKPEGLDVVVIDEKDGFVKLSLAKGNRKLRETLANGADLDTPALEMETTGNDSNLKKSWTALKKAVGYVKTMDGVKAVLVTAETNTRLDQAEDLVLESIRLDSNGNKGLAADKMRQAADIGYDAAQLYLGAWYSNGNGVTQDYKEAAKWFGLAADQGNVQAQFFLGDLYYYGHGVSKSNQEAAKWYRLAADQGDSSSQSRLAWLLSTCKESRLRNGPEAVKYAEMAVAQASLGELKASYLDKLAAAQARVGNYEKAAELAEQSIAIFQPKTNIPNYKKTIESFKVRLDSYRNKQPWTDNGNE